MNAAVICVAGLLLCVPLPAGAAAAAAPEPPAEHVVRVPPDLFSPKGMLGALELEASRVILADGKDNSRFLFSPAMARMGFAPIPFTVPPRELEVSLGFLATAVRLRIPGSDPADPATTIQSTGLTARFAGTNLEVTARFESEGPELVAEYYGRLPAGGDGWVRTFEIELDGLTVTVATPVESQGAGVGLGPPAVRADFSLAMAAHGLSALVLDDTEVKDYVRKTLEDAVARALDLERYRAPLAAALTSWLRQGPFSGLAVRAIRPRPAADGGLELVAVTGGP